MFRRLPKSEVLYEPEGGTLVNDILAAGLLKVLKESHHRYRVSTVKVF